MFCEWLFEHIVQSSLSMNYHMTFYLLICIVGTWVCECIVNSDHDKLPTLYFTVYHNNYHLYTKNYTGTLLEISPFNNTSTSL
jgi:hypothetical protein